MKKVLISIEDIDAVQDNGITKVWWWREDGNLNEEWESKKPIWNLLNAKQIFMLIKNQDTITIEKKLLTNNFNKI